MHKTLNWCFTRVLIDAIGFNRCFILSSFNLATLQQFFKKRQNRRYYHFKSKLWTCSLNWFHFIFRGCHDWRLSSAKDWTVVALPNILVTPTCVSGTKGNQSPAPLRYSFVDWRVSNSNHPVGLNPTAQCNEQRDRTRQSNSLGAASSPLTGGDLNMWFKVAITFSFQWMYSIYTGVILLIYSSLNDDSIL